MKATPAKLAIVEKKASDPELTQKGGAAQMREAASKTLEDDSTAIAKALSKNSKKGDIQSARFLYALALEKEKAGEGNGARKLRSMAEELARAAQWTGDWPKAKHDEDDENAIDA